MVGRGRAEGAFAELTAVVVDDDDGVAALVCVDAENHHRSVSLSFAVGATGPAGGHSSVGAVPRSYQATPVGPAGSSGRTRGPGHERHKVVERAGRAKITFTLTKVVCDPVLVRAVA
ncbi:hypothetical protein GCM10023175_57830 [Pseudonocardia xishanensis]|uniref:Uncharacterized protein n=1 Tax=Pseudonocardia xishanensis TaxID=630995 RepID=A0ABP8S1Y9_9PSEU